jgi:hypothetical protein
MEYFVRLFKNFYGINHSHSQQQLNCNKPSNPNSPLLFESLFSPYFAPANPPKKSVHRIWQFITLFNNWLIVKVTNCFHYLQNKQELTKTKKQKEELNELFNQPIIYDKFRDQVLSYKTDQAIDPFFQNHTLQSYLQLKNHDLSIFENITDASQKESIAAFASYDAIVDLYVNRFLEKNPEMDNETFLPSLKMTALCIALKIACDQAIYNSYFSGFLPSSLEKSTHHAMEAKFLNEIGWNTSTAELVANFA